MVQETTQTPQVPPWYVSSTEPPKGSHHFLYNNHFTNRGDPGESVCAHVRFLSSLTLSELICLVETHPFNRALFSPSNSFTSCLVTEGSWATRPVRCPCSSDPLSCDTRHHDPSRRHSRFILGPDKESTGGRTWLPPRPGQVQIISEPYQLPEKRTT